jgi:hypothetical protein
MMGVVDGSFDEHLRRQLPGLPTPENANADRRYGQEQRAAARAMWERLNGPSEVVGVAVEDSIEDPFTGHITVTIQLT